MYVRLKVFALALVAMMLPNLARAEMIDFWRITSNSSQNIAAQLHAEVTDASVYDSNNQLVTAKVRFRITDIGSVASFVDGVFFDDGTLLSLEDPVGYPAPVMVAKKQGNKTVYEPKLDGNRGVYFLKDPNGHQPLPGGQDIRPKFEAIESFTAQAFDPSPTWGVNGTPDLTTYEYLDLVFTLLPNKVYGDTVAALHSGELRIGLHVQGIAGATSDSFVNVIPTPATAGLSLFGLAGLGMARLRRRQV